MGEERADYMTLGELESLAAAVWGPAILDSISAKSRAVILIRAVLDGREDVGASKAEGEAILREARARPDRKAETR